MTQSFFVPGPLPGMNEYAGTKTRWHYKRMKSEWGATIRYYIKQEKLQPMARAEIKFLWIEKDRRRDPDNIMSAQKFVLDAIVTAGLMNNDGWNQIEGIAHRFQVAGKGDNPGVLVFMSEA